jgi:hypothetical protein
MRQHVLAGVLLLAGVCVPSLAAAQRVIVFVDGAVGDGYLGTCEGYYRGQNPGGGVHVGGVLTDSLAQLVQNGDCVVIIVHGQRVNGVEGGGISWGGEPYSGFGGGTGVPVFGDPAVPRPYPLPPGWSTRSVKVKIVSCWSSRDPDNAGGQKSVVQSVIEASPGSQPGGITGFAGVVTPRPRIFITGGSLAQRNAAYDTLASDTTWMMAPPANRPQAPVTQGTAAQDIINNRFPNKNMVVTISYPLEPTDQNPQPAFTPQWATAATSVAPALIETCAPVGPPITPITTPGVPGHSWASLASMVILLAAGGAWRGARARRATG